MKLIYSNPFQDLTGVQGFIPGSQPIDERRSLFLRYAQIFFTTFFGALGLLMALPLAVVVKTWLEEVLFKDVLDRWQKPA